MDTPRGIVASQFVSIKPRQDHVAEYQQQSNIPVHEVFDASILACGPELLRGPELHLKPFSLGSGADMEELRPRIAFDDGGFAQLAALDRDDINAVLSKLPPQFPPSQHPLLLAISEFKACRRLYTHPRMRLLALFAIVEAMLVHKPNETDPYSSISRQLVKKMELLNSRFLRQINYDAYRPQGLSLESLWKMLYTVRSEIAHGAKLDFKSGKYQPLRDIDNTIELVTSVVRSLLRQKLEEPRLIDDLREC